VLLLGMEQRDCVVDLLHGRQYRLLVIEQAFVGLKISDIDTRVAKANRWTALPIGVIGTTHEECGPPWAPSAPLNITRGNRSAVTTPMRALAAASWRSAA
jgi:hypothetical protein